MYIYLGDDDIRGAAAYLSGVMLHAKIPFERVDSSQSPAADFCSKNYQAYIVSDYPGSNFKPEQLEHIRNAVREGSGLLMLGGWESYHGRLGEYHDTVLTDVLPIKMLETDDRRNFAQPTLIYPEQDHPIFDGQPWDRPPFVGGFNQFTAKPDAKTLLRAVCTDVRIIRDEQKPDITAETERLTISLPNGDAMLVTLTKCFPMLVVGQYGKGRTAALATDVAPHWVGGFVDWGRERIVQAVHGGESIEVGADYARFFSRLVQWTGGESLTRNG